MGFLVGAFVGAAIVLIAGGFWIAGLVSREQNRGRR